MTTTARSLLGAVLLRCAQEEGGLRALARAIGISPQTLHEVLGGRVPGTHVRRAIATYLAIAPAQVAEWAAARDG